MLRNDFREFFLAQGIEDPEAFVERHRETSSYLGGRTPHPSVPIGGGQRVVIRHYSHGGFLRGITRDLYLFGSRSMRELVLMERALSSGIPTAQPIGAIHRPVLILFYKAYLLSLHIPGAMDLIQYLREIGQRPSPKRLLEKRRTIRSAGHLVRQFHDAGFFHGDLQLKNILVSGEKVFLIDFDQSHEKSELALSERAKNLLRLNRSAEKWKSLGLPISCTDRLRFFIAYAKGDEEIWKAMRRALRTYALRRPFHRWSWVLQRILRNERRGSMSR